MIVVHIVFWRYLVAFATATCWLLCLNGIWWSPGQFFLQHCNFFSRAWCRLKCRKMMFSSHDEVGCASYSCNICATFRGSRNICQEPDCPPLPDLAPEVNESQRCSTMLNRTPIVRVPELYKADPLAIPTIDNSDPQRTSEPRTSRSNPFSLFSCTTSQYTSSTCLRVP